MAEQRNPEPPLDDPSNHDVPAYRWHEVWLKVLANPSDATFKDILSVPGVSTRRALRWVFIAQIAVVAILVGFFIITTNEWGIIQFLPQIAVTAVLHGIVGVVGFVITSLFIQGVARISGGEGSFEQFHYAYAASAAPLAIIQTLVALTGPSLIFFVALAVYQLVLIGMALRAVNNFSRGRTVVTLLGAVGLLALIPFTIMLFISIVGG